MWSGINKFQNGVACIFQYNICTCGAFSFFPEKHIILLFQYNICTCGAKLGQIRDKNISGFQYNICTCGAIAQNYLDQVCNHFNTTFVHVELADIETSKNVLTISIQHLYMWSP